MEFQPPIHQEERGKFCINSHVDKEVIGLNKTQTGQSSYQLEQQKAKTSVSHCHLEHSGQVDLGLEPRYRFEKFQSQKLGNCLESCDGEYQPQQWQQDHSQIGEQLTQYNRQPLVPHQLCSNCAKHQGSLLPQQKPQNHIIPHLSNTRIPDDRSRWRRTSSTSAPSLQVHNSTREHSSLPPSESVHKSLSLRRLTDWLPNEYGNVEGQSALELIIF
ncbi:unnamed protein product [Protopolystoma xenopodis]|uniref:Uncharacterized protein n=1 Tax=Protopolystoma xenopodis TaxID=117903 RepID=A0A3S5CLV7_9PLAT|nr:unnamed protein product [Protopolystoma xenopodis]